MIIGYFLLEGKILSTNLLIGYNLVRLCAYNTINLRTEKFDLNYDYLDN